jgi:phage/plasmid-like protein (TIGR03299 family)
MSHELQVAADGRASMAYIGATPWHGLGQSLTPGADLITWQQEAGLDWEAKTSKVRYDRMHLDYDNVEKPVLTDYPDRRVIYRSDTGTPLSVVSSNYRPVQPSEVIGFYRDLTEKFGFDLETAGALKGGRRIWALANTRNSFQLAGNDINKLYLLLATSFDGTMATQARLTGVRVVCNNTIELATQGGRENAIYVPHSTRFDADQVKLQLNVGEAWSQYRDDAEKLASTKMERAELMQFLLDAYYDLDTDEKIAEFREEHGPEDKSVKRFLERLTTAFFESPGAQMASARGTLWGALNAVTFDVDHALPSRTQENRLDKAWFGDGATIKARAWDRAMKLAA